MPVTVRNTDILFNDGTTQTTAAGAIPTDFGAVGTYAVLQMAANTNLATGGTIAGSSLRFNYTPNNTTSPAGANFAPFVGFQTHFGNSNYNGGGTAVSGTWRKMSTGTTHRSSNDGYGTNFFWHAALYVRIS
jgi:hypothetical protein